MSNDNGWGQWSDTHDTDPAHPTPEARHSTPLDVQPRRKTIANILRTVTRSIDHDEV